MSRLGIILTSSFMLILSHNLLSVGKTITVEKIISDQNEWSNSGFRNPSVNYLFLKRTENEDLLYTHSLSVTLVAFRDAGWDQQDVEARIKRVAEVYSQCGIHLNEVKLVIADSYEGILDVSRFKNAEEIYTARRIASSVPITPKPIVFFVRSINRGITAYAIWARDPDKYPFANTAWISRAVTEKWYLEAGPKSYSVEAHEIGHLFLGIRHVQTKQSNFLHGDPKLADDTITTEQCDLIKRHELVSEID